MGKKLKYQTWSISQLNNQLKILDFAEYGNRLKTIELEKYNVSEWSKERQIKNKSIINGLYKWSVVIYKEMEIIKEVIKEKKNILNEKLKEK